MNQEWRIGGIAFLCVACSALGGSLRMCGRHGYDRSGSDSGRMLLRPTRRGPRRSTAVEDATTDVRDAGADAHDRRDAAIERDVVECGE